MSASTQFSPDGQPFPAEHWRNVLGEAVKEVFSMMIGTEVTIAEGEMTPADADVTGMVGLAGDCSGVLSVRCSTNSAAKITSQMLGVPIGEASSQLGDAIGEVCNMIAGNFKAKIDNLQDKCMLSVPTVITGEDYQFRSLASGDRIERPFLYDGEVLWVALDIKS